MKSMVVIGINGRTQADRTVLREGLREWIQRSAPRLWTEYASFADPLKRIAATLYLEPGTGVHEVDEAGNLIVTPGGKTMRQVLKYLSDEIFRPLNPDIWVDCLRRELDWRERHYPAGLYGVCLIDDVQFPNEARLIKEEWRGLLIRLKSTPGSDKHASETALDHYGGFDLVMDETLTTAQTLEAVVQMEVFRRFINTLSHARAA